MATLINTIAWVLELAIIGRVIVSWLRPDPRNPLVQALFAVTEPILAPLRRVIPLIGMFDITPIVAIILIEAISRILVAILV